MRAIYICSSEELLKDELKTVEKIGLNAGHPRKTINKLIQKNKERIDWIPTPAQRKQDYALPLPFMDELSLKIKREISKLEKTVPITPNPSLFKMIRNDVEKYEYLETTGVHKINVLNTEKEEMSYIGMTKRKIGNIKYIFNFHFISKMSRKGVKGTDKQSKLALQVKIAVKKVISIAEM